MLSHLSLFEEGGRASHASIQKPYLVVLHRRERARARARILAHEAITRLRDDTRSLSQEIARFHFVGTNRRLKVVVVHANVLVVFHLNSHTFRTLAAHTHYLPPYLCSFGKVSSTR